MRKISSMIIISCTILSIVIAIDTVIVEMYSEYTIGLVIATVVLFIGLGGAIAYEAEKENE